MRFDRFLEQVAPAVALAIAGAGKAGCGGKFAFNGKEGVPLADLDLAGDAPDTVNLMGPDRVRIVEGEDFSIAQEGSAREKDRMRFVLGDGVLSILRAHDEGDSDGTGRATVTISAPALRRLVMAGSGEIRADALADRAEVAIAGSGSIETPGLAVSSLEIGIAGSGHYKASGTAGRLAIGIAGTGHAKLKRLKAASADVSLAGSGDADFASDGEVRANILGAGTVTVRGDARCKVSGFGSGTLRCKRGKS